MYNFDKEYVEKIKIQRKVENKKNSCCSNFAFAQKLFIIIFLKMISLYKLHFHIHYEEVY